VCQPDIEARNAGLANWAQAPAARYAHPREEHLMPLLVAAGAAGNDVGVRTFNDVMMDGGSRLPLRPGTDGLIQPGC